MFFIRSKSDAKSFNFKQALLVVRLTTTPDVAKKIVILSPQLNTSTKKSPMQKRSLKLKQQRKKGSNKEKTSTKEKNKVSPRYKTKRPHTT